MRAAARIFGMLERKTGSDFFDFCFFLYFACTRMDDRSEKGKMNSLLFGWGGTTAQVHSRRLVKETIMLMSLNLTNGRGDYDPNSFR